MTAPILSINDLAISFQTDDGIVAAVDGLSLDIAPGQAVGLVGESGCGKSVSALAALRLLPQPQARIHRGQIRFHTDDILTLPNTSLRAIRGRQIAMIFQEPMTALSPLMRIGDQMLEALCSHGHNNTPAARTLCRDWLARVGIPDPAERMLAYPFQLSGGMRQRAMIAMALMLQPALLIADEPTTALDVTLQAQILDLIRESAAQHGTAVLFITHDMGVVWEICDTVAVMYAGELVELGPVDNVITNPAHPYTLALLRSRPQSAVKGVPLPVIPGSPPIGSVFPAGCRFRERCPHAFDRCAQHPPMFQRTNASACRCFLHDDPTRLPPSHEPASHSPNTRPEGRAS